MTQVSQFGNSKPYEYELPTPNPSNRRIFCLRDTRPHPLPTNRRPSLRHLQLLSTTPIPRNATGAPGDRSLSLGWRSPLWLEWDSKRTLPTNVILTLSNAKGKDLQFTLSRAEGAPKDSGYANSSPKIVAIPLRSVATPPRKCHPEAKPKDLRFESSRAKGAPNPGGSAGLQPHENSD
jgi:hypothetical protein